MYAFRGGDLDTYLVAGEYVREHGGEDSLDTNYRSRPAVLGAIEALFTHRPEPFRSEIGFHPVIAARAGDEDALVVEGAVPPGLTVHWLPPPPDTSTKRRPRTEEHTSEIQSLMRNS